MLDLTTPSLFVFSHIINITGLHQPFPVVRQRGPHIERKTPADTRSERYCTDCKPPQTALPDPFDADTRGILSLLLCVISMFFIYISWQIIAAWIFGVALLLLAASLCVCIWEINISVKALGNTFTRHKF